MHWRILSEIKIKMSLTHESQVHTRRRLLLHLLPCAHKSKIANPKSKIQNSSESSIRHSQKKMKPKVVQSRL